MFSDPKIQFRKLAFLQIHASLSNVEMRQLADKKFPLREIRLEILHETDLLVLFQLLSSLCGTLEKLVLSFPFDYNAYAMSAEFPVLRKVNYLCLHGYEGPIDFVDYGLPNLKMCVFMTFLNYYMSDYSFLGLFNDLIMALMKI